MSCTPTLPPNDKGMWRRLVGRAHPDVGGDHDLFIWAVATRTHVCGGELGTEIPQREPREHPSRRREASSSGTGERVPFDEGVDFVAGKDRALDIAEEVEEPYKSLLYLLLDCTQAGIGDDVLYRQQRQGATYKSLAAIGHKVAMTKPERVQWYRIAESVPLSQRHAGHILSKLQRAAA
jgi:hypothetical protein